MSEARPAVPPLSPVLLAGLLLRPVPPVVLQPALNLAMALMKRRHPDVFERLGEYADGLFLIDPLDLPFVFLLRPDPAHPSLAAVREVPGEAPTGTIRGPMLALIDLLEGRVDGDALFFSRDLAVEGDTEAVVALRNAVDGAGIDLVADLLAPLGPLAEPARALAGRVGGLASRLAQDIETLRAAVIAPAVRRAEAQSARIRDLEEAVADLRRQASKGKAARS